MSLQTRITALVQAIGADIKALYSGKVGTSDARLTDAREWTASTVTQAEAEAGTATTRRAWTAQRVFQAIAAWWAASAMKTKLDGIATGATANATDAQLRARSTHTGTQAISTVTGLQTALDGKISTTERGVSGGVATLDQFARIPPSQLPSYVDDVLEYLTTAEFPAAGETGKIYIAINQGTAANPTRQYRWTGSVYAEINPSPGTTDALAEGSTNLYFTQGRVRSAVLTGLSLASTAVIGAADTVLSALGKLQAQISLRAPLDSPPLTGNPTAPTPAATDNDDSIATTAHVKAAMGLFGLGSATVMPVPNGDLNNVADTGFNRFDNVEANRPCRYGTVITIRRTAQDATQIAFDRFDALAVYIRRQKTGVWDSSWGELFHTGNLVKQTDATDTTPGAMLAVGAANILSATASEGFDVLKGSRFLRAGTEGPLGSAICGGVTIGVTGTIEQQLAMRYGRAFFRSKGDTEGDWRELWHASNFNPATKQDKSSLVTTTTSRTLALTDAWNYLRPGTTSAITLTVPTNASVAFDIGTEITVRALGNVTLAAASGVTLNAPSGGTLSMTARMTVTLKKVATNEWDVIGQTVAA